MKSKGLDKGHISGLDQKITRKEALLKAGKYTAFTAAAMMEILEAPAQGNRPPKKSPKPPRPHQNKSATKPRNDPPPTY
jgi:hypothetical protein